ncbi:hypothetical protein HNQ92_000759 [Rhabdobacter roseus]|uniref:Carboxypeptidase-like regulatory domain-containing protein n=1 Tax=Rhabdobacter roseus TaxID=1655419 RepID=A0A840TRN2_9BACT|nr:carboxypeptidase-like regulatory domain-containing protein [Rhabdobacter roseus]MBB5282638.1 hypothetical protein [Rhabdobacter roseus]
MSAKIVLVLVLSWLSPVLLAQNPCGVIVNELDEPIPYAVLYVKVPTPDGVYASEDGSYCLALRSETDSVYITCIGYQAKTWSVQEFRQHDTIRLEKVAIKLEEVVVKRRSHRVKENELGYAARSTPLKYSVNSGTTLVTYIPNEKHTSAQILSLTYAIQPRTRMKKVLEPLSYRLALYLYADENGQPGRNLVPEPFMVTISNQDKTIRYSVEPYGIDFPERGVWVGLACVGYVDVDSVYYGVGDSRKFTRYSGDKLPVISPLVPVLKSAPGPSLRSTWNGAWKPFMWAKNRPGTLCFGVTVGRVS